MKVSRESREIITQQKLKAFELQQEVQLMLKRLDDCSGTKRNQKQLAKVLPILEDFIRVY